VSPHFVEVTLPLAQAITGYVRRQLMYRAAARLDST